MSEKQNYDKILLASGIVLGLGVWYADLSGTE